MSLFGEHYRKLFPSPSVREVYGLKHKDHAVTHRIDESPIHKGEADCRKVSAERDALAADKADDVRRMADDANRIFALEARAAALEAELQTQATEMQEDYDALAADNAALRVEIAKWRGERYALSAELATQVAWKERYLHDYLGANERAQALDAAWRKYGRHQSQCQRYEADQCTCGFVATERALLSTQSSPAATSETTGVRVSDKQACTCTDRCAREGRPFPAEWSWRCKGLPAVCSECGWEVTRGSHADDCERVAAQNRLEARAASEPDGSHG